jgi:cytochrome c biogenesis protein CcdA
VRIVEVRAELLSDQRRPSAASAVVATGVVLSLLAIVVSFVVAVHPTRRRLAGWTIGLTLGLVSGLLLLATLWTFDLASDEIENWPASTVSAFMLSITSVFGFTSCSRADGSEARTIRDWFGRAEWRRDSSFPMTIPG